MTPHVFLQRNPEANTVTPVWIIVQPKKEQEKEPYPGVIGTEGTWMR